MAEVINSKKFCDGTGLFSTNSLIQSNPNSRTKSQVEKDLESRKRELYSLCFCIGFLFFLKDAPENATGVSSQLQPIPYKAKRLLVIQKPLIMNNQSCSDPDLHSSDGHFLKRIT
jgi:hypothetical protein